MNVSPMNQEKILIVEDEENERTGLAELVSAWGYRAETARDGAEGLDKVTSWAPSIVVTDLKMPRMGGLELLERLATDSQTMAVIVVTAQGTIDSAVQAMRMGAYDYITKPIDTNRLRTILQNASALLGTKAENEAMRRKLRDAGSLGSLVGASKKMQEIFRLIEMVAPSTASVLITGASGTGKELVARTVRVRAATNKVPEEAVAYGELRNDLYYRLNVFNIHMPLLREHRADIPELVQSVLADMNLKHGRKVAGVSEAVLNLFRNYSWQGNVRELRNTLERAVIVCDGPVVETKHLPPNFGQTAIRTSAEDPDAVRLGVGTTVEEAEKLLILKTLEATNNNKTRAAEILGISLKTLHNKLKEYGSGTADGATGQQESPGY